MHCRTSFHPATAAALHELVLNASILGCLVLFHLCIMSTFIGWSAENSNNTTLMLACLSMCCNHDGFSHDPALHEHFLDVAAAAMKNGADSISKSRCSNYRQTSHCLHCSVDTSFSYLCTHGVLVTSLCMRCRTRSCLRQQQHFTNNSRKSPRRPCRLRLQPRQSSLLPPPHRQTGRTASACRAATWSTSRGWFRRMRSCRALMATKTAQTGRARWQGSRQRGLPGRRELEGVWTCRPLHRLPCNCSCRATSDGRLLQCAIVAT